jgi:DNA-binding CsgD family transcriptional regulator
MLDERERIGRHDAARIEDLVDQLDAANDLEDFGRIVAAGMLALVPGISASYNEVNTVAGRAFAVIVPEPDTDWWEHYTPIFERLAHQHPYLRHLADGGHGAAGTWDEVPGGDTFRTTELYRQFYAPLGIETQLAAQLPAPDGIVVGLAVNRGPEGFSERDRIVLDAIRSHAIRSYRFLQRTRERDALGQVLSDQGWHAMLVDDDGIVVSTSAPERHWPVGATLPEPVLSSFRQTPPPPFWSGAAPGPPVHVAGVAPGSDVLVQASIVRNRVPPHVVHVRRGAAVSHRRLLDRGLTDRQATIAALMAGGASNGDIGRELGISPATVKKHLEAVYRVLGVSSRAAAVAAITHDR